MARSLIRSGFAILLVFLTSTLAVAQSSSTSITGLVVDTGGGVLPGANVVVKNNANARRMKRSPIVRAHSLYPAWIQARIQ